MAIDILMSTYNGEKYLENQLLSLLMQRYKDWMLYIRDDGSTDSTLAIIDRFSQLDNRIKLVDKGSNLGHGRSFFSLLKYATADYIAFCDQDDIWLEDKLLHSLNRIIQKDNEPLPLLVCSQGYNYSDQKGTVIKGTIPQYRANSLKQFLFLNGGYEGCLFIFNKALLNIAKEYTATFYGHDNIICLIAHTFGRVEFLQEDLMLYRIHDNNTSGFKKIGLWSRLISFFRQNTSVITKVSYSQQKAFFDFFYEQLSVQQIELFNAYFAFPTLSKYARIKLLIKYRFRLGQYHWVLILKTILRKAM